MEFSYPEDSSNAKSSCSEETDDTGTGRSYECVFCKRGFTTAQALGGHMNIHRKDRANNNKTKPNFPSPSSSSSNKVVDDNNYADLGGFYSGIPRHLAAVHGGNYCYSSTAAPEVDTTNYDYRQIYFPAPACGARPSHVQYGEVENQRNHGHHPFGQDYWRQRSLSLYANPLCVRENEDKVGDNSEENGPDLELRLGHHP